MPLASALRLSAVAPVALVLALVLSLALAGCGSSHSRFESHMARGRQYLAADNLEKASIEFRNALQIEPKSMAALYLNGTVAERRGDFNEAAESYQAAVDAQPDDTRVRASLAKLFVLGGVPQRALEIISPGLLDHPDDPDLLAARAAARHQLKDDSQARADAERAALLAPTNENAIGVLAALALRAGDTQKALTLVTSAVEKSPGSIELRRILANVDLANGQPQQAEKQMHEIIALEPNELAPRMELATWLTQRRELDAAQQLLEQAVRDLPRQDAAKLALADFVTTQRSTAQGEKILREFVAREPDNEDLQLALGLALQRAGARQEAVALYRQIIRRSGLGSKGLAARDRIAAMEIAAGHTAEAASLLAQVLAENPRDDDALIMHADMALAANDPDGAIADFRAVLHDQPKSVVLQRSLARAYLAKGEPALAEEALRSVLDSGAADTDSRIDLARVFLQTGRPAQAVTLLEESVRQAPQDPQARVALIEAYLADHDMARARAAAQDLQVLRPDLAAGYQLAGDIARDEQRPDDAEQNLERALQLQPDSLEVLTALTHVSLERGRPVAAAERLQRVLARDPTNPQVMDLLGVTYLQMKDLPHATEALDKAIALAPRSWTVYADLAQVRLAAGDPDGALKHYRTAFSLAPTQPRIAVELAQLYEKQGHVDAAISCYEALYEGDAGARRIAANNLAMLLVTYKTDQASLDRARTLTASFATTGEASLLDTAGWVRFKRREYREAIVSLERAADRSPDSKVIRYHLGMAQLRLGQKASARANLEVALSGSASFAGSEEARSALASLRAARTG